MIFDLLVNVWSNWDCWLDSRTLKIVVPFDQRPDSAIHIVRIEREENIPKVFFGRMVAILAIIIIWEVLLEIIDNPTSSDIFFPQLYVF